MALMVATLTGCAWIPAKPLVQGATTAQPIPGPVPVANGSIFQSAQPINYGYQPLFEDRRPRNIGDTLTIVLQENVSASKSSSANGGRITNGAIIERELPTQFGAGNTINLQLNDEDFTMAQQITDAINRARGYGSATALDARTVQVRVPSGNSSQVRFLADIQNMEVNVTPQDAKVVINSRTGSVVMNREVTLDSCAVAQGNLSVTVNRQLNVNQPNTPFGGGQTVVTPQTQIDLRQSGGSLQSVRSSANLNSVVRALNALGATPMDLMSILQSMQSAGCLRAKLEII